MNDYQEPNVQSTAPVDVHITQVIGAFNSYTPTTANPLPTWTPKTLADSIALSTDDVEIFYYDKTNKKWGTTKTTVQVPLSPYFGNGDDGSITLDGTSHSFATLAGSTYTLTQDLQCTDLTINSGITLKTANFRIYCTGTFTNNGTVDNSGADGQNAVTNVPGTGGVALVAQTLGASGSGADGGGGAGSTGGLTSNSLGGNGGNGGDGQTDPGFTPVRGGSAGTATKTLSSPNIGFSGMLMGIINAGSLSLYTGGAGGGAGAGTTGTVGYPGGGGAGAGIIYIAAATFINNGTIRANGGNGGNGDENGGYVGGGGGGGGGGCIVTISGSYTNTGSLLVNGGLGGSGGYSGGQGAVGTTYNLSIY